MKKVLFWGVLIASLSFNLYFAWQISRHGWHARRSFLRRCRPDRQAEFRDFLKENRHHLRKRARYYQDCRQLYLNKVLDPQIEAAQRQMYADSLATLAAQRSKEFTHTYLRYCQER